MVVPGGKRLTPFQRGRAAHHVYGPVKPAGAVGGPSHPSHAAGAIRCDAQRQKLFAGERQHEKITTQHLSHNGGERVVVEEINDGSRQHPRR